MVGLRRLISFIFFILSLVTLIGMAIMIGDLLTHFGFSMTFEDFFELIADSTIKDILYGFALLMYGMLSIMGVPIIILITSSIGLSLNDN